VTDPTPEAMQLKALAARVYELWRDLKTDEAARIIDEAMEPERAAAKRLREAGVNLRQAVQVYWPDDKPKPRFLEVAITAVNEALNPTKP
jgi:hypothetical protein